MVILHSCAQIVAPTGGPKDITPPQVVFSTPENYTTNFDRNKIVIGFDEFIKLNNVNQQLVISPLLEEKPDIYMQGKKLIIDLNNDLDSNTTYTFNFGKAIADINENNPLTNYQFVFSTGDKLDSLRVGGHILNAFDLKPQEEVFVMLYKTMEDSTPCRDLPDYIGRTDKSGAFFIPNIRPGEYGIFGLKDINNNYIFDQPNESIAFFDSLVVPQVEVIEVIDTIRIDSLDMDSIDVHLHTAYSPDTLELYLFDEHREKQYLATSAREIPERCELYFNQPLDTLAITPVNFSATDEWYLTEANLTNDSIILWLTDTAVKNIDTLKVELKYYMKDSLDQTILFADTIKLNYKATKKKKKEAVVPELKITSNVKGSKLDLDRMLALTFVSPVAMMDTALFKLYEIVDTLEIEKKFELVKDTVQLRRYFVDATFEEAKSYKFFADTLAFKDVFGVANDTFIVNFRMRELAYYGNIMLTLSNITSDVVIQLMDKKENVLKQLPVTNDGVYTFKYLKPQDYMLKLIFDDNKDGEWTTGKYMENIHPERVLYFQESINVRSNWDLELNWEITK